MFSHKTSKTNQQQKAGNNSNQIQITNNGVNAAEVVQIVQTQMQTILQQTTAIAHNVATERIMELQSRLLKDLATTNTMQGLVDPAIQYQIGRAEKAAAISDRSSDYDVLSQLIVQRIQKKDDKYTATATEMAIEIVDKVSTEALDALTIVAVFEIIIVKLPTLNQVLASLNAIYREFHFQSLPDTADWVENLELLNVIKVRSGGLKDFQSWFYSAYPDLVTLGIRKDSDAYLEATKLLDDVKLNDTFLPENPLDDAYARIVIDGVDSIPEMTGMNGGHEVPLNEDQIEALETIHGLYSGEQLDVNAFNNLLHQQADLTKIAGWWDSLAALMNGQQQAVSLTKVGRALGYTNAKRLNPELPEYAY